jgi:hypothetical protein
LDRLHERQDEGQVVAASQLVNHARVVQLRRQHLQQLVQRQRVLVQVEVDGLVEQLVVAHLATTTHGGVLFTRPRPSSDAHASTRAPTFWMISKNRSLLYAVGEWLIMTRTPWSKSPVSTYKNAAAAQ